LKFTLISLFPEKIQPWLEFGPISSAIQAGSLETVFLNLKHYAKTPKHVDDYPFGGGPGMVMRPEPLARAITDARQGRADAFVMLTSARGKRLDQATVKQLARKEHLIVVCGRYKDVDNRVLDWVDMEFSLGDFVLSGGEIPALALLDAVARLLPGALGSPESGDDDSFQSDILGPPSYTRPPEYMGKRVPAVLLSGDHGKVRGWRRKQALLYTLRQRPDLLVGADPEYFDILREITKERQGE